MQNYAEFANYDGGISHPEQLTREIFENVTFINTRNTEVFDRATIPGATISNGGRFLAESTRSLQTAMSYCFAIPERRQRNLSLDCVF
jgi:hypothetical protein